MSENREIRRSESFPRAGEHKVDITSPCVFRVPKILRETKPEAYVPQKLGLGAFHYFRRDLYTMQRKKFDEVVTFVEAVVKEGHANMEQVIKYVSDQPHLIRGSYDESLNIEHAALATVVATDAIYLLSCLDPLQVNTDDTETKRILAGDILMLENQIPGEFLVEIWGILKPGDHHVLCSNVLSFCNEVSPLKLTAKPADDVVSFLREGHLLNVLYNLILPRSKSEREQRLIRGRIQRSITKEQAEREEEIKKNMRIFGAAELAERLGCAPQFNEGSKGSADAGPACPQVDLAGLEEALSGAPLQGGAVLQKELSILQKLPWDLFFSKLKKIDPDRDENTSSVKEIGIPSVSLLAGNAGIRFAVAERGITDIKFNEKNKTLYLPAMTLHSNSEVILRNLLAYEAAITKPRSTLEFAEYVDLMCGIVDTAQDVKILCRAGIIVSDLKSAEIARIFNGIWRSTGEEEEEEEEHGKKTSIFNWIRRLTGIKNSDKAKTNMADEMRSTLIEDENKDKRKNKHKKRTNVGQAIKQLKEMYGSRPKVRALRMITTFFGGSWKFFAVFSSAIIVMLLALQAFCEIYDCRKNFSLTSKYNPSKFFDEDGSLFSM